MSEKESKFLIRADNGFIYYKKSKNFQFLMIIDLFTSYL